MTVTHEPTRQDRQLLIAGSLVDADARIEVWDPAQTTSSVGSVPRGTVQDVDDAVRAAQAAFGEWAHESPTRRAELLRAGAHSARHDAEERAVTLVRESGKIMEEARGEIRAALLALEYYASILEGFDLDEDLPSPNGRVVVTRKPMGVAAVIVPWNAPVLLTAYAVAPALAAGNTVVVKPSSEAPLAVMDFLQQLERHLPAGALNVVTGPSDAIGSHLVTHPSVRRVMFTGSTEVGRSVAALATSTLKRVTMELGGNDPAIVLRDADLSGDTVQQIARGVYPTSGQVCYSIKRIYVHRSRYDELVEKFIAVSDQLVVGHGLDPRTTMGPVINRSSLRALRELVSEAKAEGATVTSVGERLDAATWDEGCFHLPTIVTDVDHGSRLVASEQFGPVIPILPFDSEDEAIAKANDTNFGLASSIWTADEARGFDLARRIEAGTTFINVHRLGASGPDMPFGGMKESGIGRGHGVISLEEQFEIQTLSTRRPPGGEPALQQAGDAA
jgi:aldehyde dehydrogenase